MEWSLLNASMHITFFSQNLWKGQGTHDSLHGAVEWPWLSCVLTHIRVAQVLQKSKATRKFKNDFCLVLVSLQKWKQIFLHDFMWQCKIAIVYDSNKNL